MKKYCMPEFETTELICESVMESPEPVYDFDDCYDTDNTGSGAGFDAGSEEEEPWAF